MIFCVKPEFFFSVFFYIIINSRTARKKQAAFYTHSFSQPRVRARAESVFLAFCYLHGVSDFNLNLVEKFFFICLLQSGVRTPDISVQSLPL